MNRYIVAVYSGHDASACLFRNNELAYAIEKERLSRIKHDEGDPIECIDYILSAEGIDYVQVDLVVRCNWFDTKYRNDKYYERFSHVIENPNHHLFHAYAVSLVNQSKDMISLIYDGRGCRPEDENICLLNTSNFFESESVYLYHNKVNIPIEKRFSIYEKSAYKWGSFLDSIGYIYAAVSKAIFMDTYAAGKVMALASFGVESDIPEPLLPNSHSVNRAFLSYINSLSLPISWDSEIAKNLAFKVQRALENYLKSKVECLSKKYKIHDFALSGGVALNCKNNGLIGNLDYVHSLSLFPASGDDGIAIGAGVWAIREYYKDNSLIKWNVFTGKSKNINNYEKDVIDKVVDYLEQNKFIGLYDGASEFGPRALCHRSIICNALTIDMKDKLNREIKHRESFRPFGGVILSKNLPKITDEKLINPYMLAAIHIKDSFKERIPALLHIDNTVRLQVVDDETSVIGMILKKYEESTGNFVLINTSYNSKGEPIVETKEDSISCAKKIGLSVILLDGDLYYV